MRRGRLLLSVLTAATLIACNGLVGFDDLRRADAEPVGDDDDDDDAGTERDDASTDKKDAATPPPDARGPRCDPTKALGPPELVTAFDGAASGHGVRLTPDELEAFWMLDDTPRHARRTSIDAAWGPAENLPLPTTAIALISVAIGGLKLYYAGTNGLTAVTRSDRNGTFGSPKVLFEDIPSSTMSFGSVFIVDSDDIAYYDRSKPNQTELHLFRGSVFGGGISSGQQVTELNIAGSDDYLPVLNAAQTVIYWKSGPDAPGIPRFVARRKTKNDAWGKPQRVPELEDAANDGVTFVSDDDCVVYLNRATHISMSTRGK